MTGLWLLLFSIATGFTVSGLTASLYRVLAVNEQTAGGRAFRLAVMVFAAPTVIFESAMRGFLDKSWNPLVFWLAVAGVTYWSLALGLFVLDIAIHM